jgi:hypothetical protein
MLDAILGPILLSIVVAQFRTAKFERSNSFEHGVASAEF